MQAQFTVQRHFWLTPSQDVNLRYAAKFAGLKESEFIRRAVQFYQEYNAEMAERDAIEQYEADR